MAAKNLSKSFQRLVLGPKQQAKTVIGRNDRCWCGSGKKYKACHLSTDDRKRAAQRSSTSGGSQRGMF
jgi:hypothetical protein